MSAPTTISALFSALGGTGAVADLLGVGQSTASEMKRRGSVPVRHWHRIIGAKDRNGHELTLEDLHNLHREKEGAAA